MRSNIESWGMGLLCAALAACGANGEPDGSLEEDTASAPDDAQVEAVSAEPVLDGVRRIEVAPGIVREETASSTPPTAEIRTASGVYVAIWVTPDGKSVTFEGVPSGAESALRKVVADSPLELFVALAPPGTEPPAGLRIGRRFSELGSEELASDAVSAHPIAEAQAAPSKGDVVPLAATFCSQTQANDFYNGYRPGVYDNDEGVLEWTSSNYQYREARRRKDYQAFFQTLSTQWTPQQANGGLQTNYLRASTTICSGTARLTAWLCYISQDTADHGCGEAGSDIFTTHGPFSMGAGGLGTYTVHAGGDIARARLDQMEGASDHAIWSVMSSVSGSSAINGCYY